MFYTTYHDSFLDTTPWCSFLTSCWEADHCSNSHPGVWLFAVSTLIPFLRIASLLIINKWEGTHSIFPKGGESHWFRALYSICLPTLCLYSGCWGNWVWGWNGFKGISNGWRELRKKAPFSEVGSCLAQIREKGAWELDVFLCSTRLFLASACDGLQWKGRHFGSKL